MFDISIDRKNRIIYLEYNEFLKGKKQNIDFLEEMIDSLDEKNFSVLLDFFDIRSLDKEYIEEISKLLEYLLQGGMKKLAVVTAYRDCLKQLNMMIKHIKDKQIVVSYYKLWETAKEGLINNF